MTIRYDSAVAAPAPAPVAAGLEGVVVAETRLSRVDGSAGLLLIRGLPVGEAVRDWRFEDVQARLWDGLLPPGAAADLPAALGRARRAAFALLPGLLPGLRHLPPTAALRAMLAALPETGSPILPVAAAGVFLAGLLRDRRGEAPLPPDPDSGTAADFLRMLHGRPAAAAAMRALDAYLVTVSDHGLNASTFAARVVASTGAGLVPAVVAGLCALEGPLHGGAPGPVLDMLDAIGNPAAAEGWIAARLAAGERLMGFGHRIYRRRDPRADVLKSVVASLDSGRIRLAEAVERAALDALRRHKPDRPLETNVEFWTALLLDAVDVPRDAFTGVFAMGRVAGWTAHALEQRQVGRLIRPESRYVGPVPAAAA